MTTTYIKIDNDTIKEINETIIDLKPLKARLLEIEQELKEIEKEPDEIMMPNDFKFQRIELLKSEKEDISKKLAIVK